MNNYTVFYIVRHGETEWNAKHLIQGQTDIPLNDNGRAQAKDVAHALKDVQFDLAFSSDLMRAKETAEIIALEHKLAVETTKLLREREFGSLEGSSVSEFKTYDDLFTKLTYTEKRKHTFDDKSESDDDMTVRFLTFIRETAVIHPGKTVLVGTHGGIMRSLLIHLGYITYEDNAWINNGAYAKVRTDGVDFFVDKVSGIVKRADITN